MLHNILLRSRINNTLIAGIAFSCMAEGRERQNSKLNERFSVDLPRAGERCRAGVQVRTFSLACRRGADICQPPETTKVNNI